MKAHEKAMGGEVPADLESLWGKFAAESATDSSKTLLIKMDPLG